jgi:hypothetical protein
MKPALAALLLAGCTAAGPKQLDADTPMSPVCFFWCINTKTITLQEGAQIQGATAPVSISKPLTETVSTTVTETQTENK